MQAFRNDRAAPRRMFFVLASIITLQHTLLSITQTRRLGGTPVGYCMSTHQALKDLLPHIPRLHCQVANILSFARYSGVLEYNLHNAARSQLLHPQSGSAAIL